MSEQQQIQVGDTVYYGNLSSQPAGVVVAVSRDGKTAYVKPKRHDTTMYPTHKLRRREVQEAGT